MNEEDLWVIKESCGLDYYQISYQDPNSGDYFSQVKFGLVDDIENVDILCRRIIISAISPEEPVESTFYLKQSETLHFVFRRRDWLYQLSAKFKLIDEYK